MKAVVIRDKKAERRGQCDGERDGENEMPKSLDRKKKEKGQDRGAAKFPVFPPQQGVSRESTASIKFDETGCFDGELELHTFNRLQQ